MNSGCPPDRCGFVLEPGSLVEWREPTETRSFASSVDAGGRPRELSAVCCWRPVWGDTSRCLWHAEVDEKPIEDLVRARFDGPEVLDGANVSGLELGDRISFSNCRLRLSRLSDANLVGSNLSGVDLWRADLSETDLSGSDLSGANLSGADLSRANLSGARLSRANLSGAELSEADLSGANLAHSTLQSATLSRATLRYATLSGASLRRSVLSEADLYAADLSEADFYAAVLTDAILNSADLSRTNFYAADLSGSSFDSADLTDADLYEADLTGADLTRANLSGADLYAADLSKSVLKDALISTVNLQNARLTGAYLSGADLSRTNLQSVDLSGTSLRGVSLREADLQTADLSNADLMHTNLWGARLRDANLSGADLREADLRETDLRNANLTGTDLQKADLSGADLQYTTLSRANVRDADLSWTTGATLSADTVFDEDLLVGKTLYSADLRNAKLRGRKFVDVTLEDADFTDADLFKTDFSRSILIGAVFDSANCRHARFEGATLENASFIECDLRSAVLTRAKLYQATLADSKLDVRTTDYLQRIDTYDDSVSGDFDPPDASRLDSSRLRRAAWTHHLIHRHLVRSGRVREALTGEHYLREQHAYIELSRREARRQRSLFLRGRPEGTNRWTWIKALVSPHADLLNRKLTAWLTTRSESPVRLSGDVLIVSALFAAVLLFTGGLCTGPEAGEQCLSPSELRLADTVRVYLFSLFTLLGGVYAIVKASLGSVVSFGVFEPVGGLVRRYAGVSGIQPRGFASDLVSVERALGALLIVPFTLLVVQRIGLYLGSGTSEEGLGGGLLSWLRGR